MITFTTGIMIAVGVLVFVVLAKGLKIVQQSETMVIERLGEFHRVLRPGINLIIPFFDKARSITIRRYLRGETIAVIDRTASIDMREFVLDFPAQHAVTRDNVSVTVNGVLYYQVIDAKQAVYAVENLVQAIEVLAKTSLRNEIGKMELDTLFESRDLINQRLESILDEAGGKWGVKVTRVEVQDIEFPNVVEEAMRQQMVAEREKRANILRADGEREAAIRQADGEKEAAIRKAQGDREAARLEAEGQRAAIETVLQAGEGKLSPKDVTAYLIALEYLRTLPHIAKNGDRVFLPYEASAMLGSLGSIGDMLGSKLPLPKA